MVIEQSDGRFTVIDESDQEVIVSDLRLETGARLLDTLVNAPISDLYRPRGEVRKRLVDLIVQEPVGVACTNWLVRDAVCEAGRTLFTCPFVEFRTTSTDLLTGSGVKLDLIGGWGKCVTATIREDVPCIKRSVPCNTIHKGWILPRSLITVLLSRTVACPACARATKGFELTPLFLKEIFATHFAFPSGFLSAPDPEQAKQLVLAVRHKMRFTRIRMMEAGGQQHIVGRLTPACGRKLPVGKPIPVGCPGPGDYSYYWAAVSLQHLENISPLEKVLLDEAGLGIFMV